uniref:FERM domain-containing protein n=1 Tax=Strongyloides venezuelensis TaxID=75913 RepID=A0A0K0G611_STRVS
MSSSTNASLYKDPVIIVKIDESEFGKRKHHRELTSGRKFFVRVVERRDAKTLLLIFQQHVFQVSLSEPNRLMAWIRKTRAIRLHLQDLNYFLHFCDQETGIHTNTVGKTWLRIKL